MPAAAAETLHAEIAKSVNSSSGHQVFKKQTMRPVPAKSRADAQARLAGERDLWMKIVDEAKIGNAD